MKRIARPRLAHALFALALGCSAAPAAPDAAGGIAPDTGVLRMGVPDTGVRDTNALNTGAPPLCMGNEAATLDWNAFSTAGDGVVGWDVRASGAFTYGALSSTASLATELTATLGSVDSAASTLTLATATGSVEVALEGVQPSWLDALPVGHDVSAHFENGLVLREMPSGRLLLAVAEGLGYHPPVFDVGPIHVVSGGVRCVQVLPAPPPCDPGLYHLRSQLNATFTLGASTVTAAAGAPPLRLADAADAFEVALIGSAVQGGVTADHLLECEGGREGATFVAIGLATP